MKKNTNKNINVGNTFNGPTQMFGSVVINLPHEDLTEETATYTPEPLWRSPLTLAVLTWISAIIGVLGIIPIGNVIGSILALFYDSSQVQTTEELQLWAWLLLIVMTLLVTSITLRRIAKKQVRYPLFCNFAINGYGKRIVIEKIHISKCPRCGGEMKYYNKPVGWNNNYIDGKVKREVTERIPVLECKRNREHCYKVDTAEDRVE
jgi:hypothetical protein